MRLLCWLFGCNYSDAIGGGWCDLCGRDPKDMHWGPLWNRRKRGNND